MKYKVTLEFSGYNKITLHDMDRKDKRFDTMLDILEDHGEVPTITWEQEAVENVEPLEEDNNF